MRPLTAAGVLLFAGLFVVTSHALADYIAVTTPLFIFVSGLVLYLLHRNGRLQNVRVSHAIILGIGIRAVLLLSSPVLENDYYRYLWDGRMSANFVNPYDYAPADEALIALESDYWTEIAFKDVRTIYPPGAQTFFLISNLLIGETVFAFRLSIFAVDLILVSLMSYLLTRPGISRGALPLFLFHPLILHEFIVTAHVDVIAVIAIAVLLLPAALANGWLAGGAAACLVAFKYNGLILLPFVFFALNRRARGSAMISFLIVLSALFLPWSGAGQKMFEGLILFSRHWEFNGVCYQISKSALIFAGIEEASLLARTITGSLFAVIYVRWIYCFALGRLSLVSAFTCAITALLLLSPVANPWYFTWLVPLLALQMNRAVYILTISVPFSYLFFQYGHDVVPLAFLLSYGPALLVRRQT